MNDNGKYFELHWYESWLIIIFQDILSRRATTITHAEEKGSTFSKATFSTSDSATDISIDDPDFWKKWAKKAEIEEIDETMKLMMVEPRNRRKIDRLGGGGLDTSQVLSINRKGYVNFRWTNL